MVELGHLPVDGSICLVDDAAGITLMMGEFLSMGHGQTVDRKSRPAGQVGLLSSSLSVDRGIIVKIHTIFEGTSEIQQLVIARAISGLRVK